MRGLLDELDITLSRQHRLSLGAGVVAHSASHVMYHVRASEIGWVLHNTITVWARELAEQNPHLRPPRLSSTAVCAAWLTRLGSLLALHPAADELHDEVTHVVALTRRVVDRPADRVYAGPCDAVVDGDERCFDHLYARPGAACVACRSCGTEYDVSERREWMISEAADLRVPATVALSWARLLLDATIPRGTWDSWVSRRRILAHGTDRFGRPAFRFGDVRDLVADYVARPRHAA